MHLPLLVTILVLMLVLAKQSGAIKCKCNDAWGKEPEGDCKKDDKLKDCAYCKKDGVRDNPHGTRSCVTKEKHDENVKTIKAAFDGYEAEDADDMYDYCQGNPIKNTVECVCSGDDYCNQSTSMKTTSVLVAGMLAAVLLLA